MAYGSIMSISNDSSEFNNAILKITGPKAGSTVTVTQGSTVINAIEDNGVWTAEVGKGSWVVKSGNRSTTVQAELSKVYEVVLKMIGTLNETSWKEISQLSASGKASTYWAVGDCKEIVLNGCIGTLTLSNYSVCVYIIGINHFPSIEGRNLIHFQIGKTDVKNGIDVALYDSKYGGSTNKVGYFSPGIRSTQSVGWSNSLLRTGILGTTKTQGFLELSQKH